MRLADFWILIIGILALGAIYWFTTMYRKYNYTATLKFSRLALVKSPNKSFRVVALKVLDWLKYAALLLLLVALARPQNGRTFDIQNDIGIDIMIAIDTSESMSSIDFRPDRLEVAKKVVEDFISNRKYDRVGLVNFAGLAFTQSPLTSDRQSLLQFVRAIEIGDTGLDGTAIGSAIVTCVNKLKDSQAKSKVIILVTDGNSNMGEVDPVTASQIAANSDIKVYPIAVGSLEGGIYIVQDANGNLHEVRDTQNKINEGILQQIAQNTGGHYYRALDEKSLEQVMAEIDSLEATKIQVAQFTSYNELYQSFLLIGFILMLLIVLAENTFLRKLP